MRNETENIAKILDLLRSQDGYVSGEKISETLGMSRAYLWKYIHKLRECGYKIDAVTRQGYRELYAPDRLFGFEIRSGLRTDVLGKKDVVYFDEIASTNDKAYEIADLGADEGVLVIAEHQTSGKGRLGREWISPEGGLYFSLILKPELPLEDISGITLVAANAVAVAINTVSGIDARVKWPNDVFVGKKKICGILTEMKAQPDKIDFIVMGIGVNANVEKDLLPDTASSLYVELGKRINRLKLVKNVLFEFENRYNGLCKNGFKDIRKECKDLSFLFGKEVRVLQHAGEIKGIVCDISEKGALMVKDVSGNVSHVYAGDVELCCF